MLVLTFALTFLSTHLAWADLIDRSGSVLCRGLRGHHVDESGLVRRQPLRAVG